MSRDYETHITNYVLTHFRHLMTDVERAADEAVVVYAVHDGAKEAVITFRKDTPAALIPEAEAALQEGGPARRRRARDRILAAHRDEIFANACPQCGRLPATPAARMCLWCPHSWREKPPADPAKS